LHAVADGAVKKRVGLVTAAVLLGGAGDAGAEGLAAATPCPVFVHIEAADTARGANRVAATADAGALLRLVRPVLPNPAPAAAGARAAIAGALRWCTAHPAATLGAALHAGPVQAAEPAAIAPPPPVAAAAEQAAWLFARACLPGAGQPDGLRAWAGRARMPRLPAWAVVGFAGPGRPAQVFDAGTPAGKMVLVSANDGACQVVMQRATQQAAEAALARVLGRLGVTLTPVLAKPDRGDAVALRLYRAAATRHGWLLSVASVGDRYRVGGLAEVRLSAVPDPALAD